VLLIERIDGSESSVMHIPHGEMGNVGVLLLCMLNSKFVAGKDVPLIRDEITAPLFLDTSQTRRSSLTRAKLVGRSHNLQS
jgi:hypothetical protein